MAQFTLAGRRVLSGQLVRPSIGVWHADLAVDGPDALSGAQTLATEAGTTLKGTVARAETEDGVLRVRLVGGAGALGREPPAKGFRTVALRTLLADTLSAVGEALSASSDAAAMGSTVSVYARPARPAAATVADWAARKGLAWRLLADGTVWLGSAAKTAFKGEARVLRRDGDRRSLVVALEDFALGPENSLEGFALGTVIYAIRPDSLRAECLYS